jgi:hypothetical protein
VVSREDTASAVWEAATGSSWGFPQEAKPRSEGRSSDQRRDKESVFI